MATSEIVATSVVPLVTLSARVAPRGQIQIRNAKAAPWVAQSLAQDWDDNEAMITTAEKQEVNDH